MSIKINFSKIINSDVFDICLIIISFIMNEEQWNEFYNLLRDILKNSDYRFVGLDAFNEINTLLILVFIEDKIDNFNFKNPEMLKLSYIYRNLLVD